MLLAGCAGGFPAKNAAAAGAEAITLSVGPCFGFCPVYDLAVTPDGSVAFTGHRHTAELGTRSRDAGALAYRDIAEVLAPYRPEPGVAARFECEVAVADTASATITWTAADGTRASFQYTRRCPSEAGRGFEQIIDWIPDRLGVANWARQTSRPGASRG